MVVVLAVMFSKYNGYIHVQTVAIAQSVQRLATGWTVRGSTPVWARFLGPNWIQHETHTNPCTISNGFLSMRKSGGGVELIILHLLDLGLRLGGAIPLPVLCVCLVCDGTHLPYIQVCSFVKFTCMRIESENEKMRIKFDKNSHPKNYISSFKHIRPRSNFRGKILILYF